MAAINSSRSVRKRAAGIVVCWLAGVSLVFAPPPSDPAISSITDQKSFPGVPTRTIHFVISDAQTPASQLTLSATSSYTPVVPTGAIVFGGSGSNRTLTITPSTNGYGSSLITVTVQNNNRTASESFTLTSAGISLDQSLPAVSDSRLSWGDYDGDGDVDLLVVGYAWSVGGVSRIYRNDGGGAFTDVANALAVDAADNIRK